MKTLQSWIVAVFLVMFPARSLAQPAPLVDFTGGWQLDHQLSLPMDPLLELQGVPWLLRKVSAGFDATASITQSSDRLSVTFDNFRGVHNQVLLFNGQPHLTVNPAGLPTTLSTTWTHDGTVLVATGPVDADGRTAVLTERRSLSALGDVMTVDLKLTTPDGQTATTRRVYRKQQ
ncbi:MAG: hypothetical protein KC912_13970 [Proteobacteria bacterium]|nr:hypothetical protein [Pseudomonadota bacterium]